MKHWRCFFWGRAGKFAGPIPCDLAPLSRAPGTPLYLMGADSSMPEEALMTIDQAYGRHYSGGYLALVGLPEELRVADICDPVMRGRLYDAADQETRGWLDLAYPLTDGRVGRRTDEDTCTIERKLAVWFQQQLEDTHDVLLCMAGTPELIVFSGRLSKFPVTAWAKSTYCPGPESASRSFSRVAEADEDEAPVARQLSF